MPIEPASIFIGDLNPSTVALLKQVADEAATRAVDRAFTAMGLEVADPIRSQRYFVAMRDMIERSRDDEVALDRAFMRRWRLRIESVPGRIMMALIVVAVASGLHAMYVGMVTMINKPPGQQ